MTDYGTVFPPRHWMDVYAYPDDDVTDGYREASPREPAPGDNRSPGYRWGWANGIKDATHQNDGLDGIRYEFIRQMRASGNGLCATRDKMQ